MLVGIIVRQLDPRLNVFDRFDEDSTFLPDRFAVGITGMVNESGDASPAAGIDGSVLINLEQVSMMA